jgi:hypothetical protein
VEKDEDGKVYKRAIGSGIKILVNQKKAWHILILFCIFGGNKRS